jgi:hypothetical protein
MEQDLQKDFVLQLMPALLEKFRKQDFSSIQTFKMRLEKLESRSLAKMIKKAVKVLSMSHECWRILTNMKIHTSYKHIIERVLFKLCGREIGIASLLKKGSLVWCYIEVSFLLQLSRIYQTYKDINGADERVNDWMSLRKMVLEFNADPMSQGSLNDHWLRVYIEEAEFKADRESYQEVLHAFQQQKEVLEKLKSDLGDSETFFQKCMYDFESEDNKKIKSSKENVLTPLLELYPQRRPNKDTVPGFIEDMVALKKKWKAFSKSQPKIMSDEKVVDKMKLAEMLGSAWKTK